jgi:chromosome segregation ATPase
MKTNEPPQARTPQAILEQSIQLQKLTQALLEKFTGRLLGLETEFKLLSDAMAHCERQLGTIKESASSSSSLISASQANLTAVVTALHGSHQRAMGQLKDFTASLAALSGILESSEQREESWRQQLEQTWREERDQDRSQLALVWAELKQTRQDSDLSMGEMSSLRRQVVMLNARIEARNSPTEEAPPRTPSNSISRVPPLPPRSTLS